MEDVPAVDLPPVERLLAYRRIRDMLMQAIRAHLLLPSRLAVLPQRK
ncbi:MAG TPA: hypothetical protein VGN15_02405 [Ktedonobacteraceae bacterium]|nr:hypothetical protein [Ktedonobacteraceae bacterium]